MREESFLSAFKAMNHNMRQMVRRFLDNEDDVSDVLQDAFCRLWVKRQSIVSDEQAKALTVVTVRNLCIDHLRRQQPTVDIGSANTVASDDADRMRDRQELYEQVKRLVDSKLTSVQREVYQLKEIEGMTTEGVAERLGMSVEAVRMNLSRARKTIRECFRERTTI